MSDPSRFQVMPLNLDITGIHAEEKALIYFCGYGNLREKNILGAYIFTLKVF